MKKVLLIEDNPEILENMAEILEMASYRVLTASDGKAGISMALEHVPDLIVCDIMMPLLDGYGVLNVLNNNALLQNIPFIFITAKSERSEMRKGMEMGADDYITKPFVGTELLKAVESRIKKADLQYQNFHSNLQGVDDLISSSTSVNNLEALKENRSINKYKKKQLIFSEGNHASRLFYILKGNVKTFKRNEDGKELIVDVHKEGEFLGYLPLLEGKAYNETAEALDDTELAIIPKSEFEDLLGSNPVVMRKFIHILVGNIIENEERLIGIAYNSLRKKVAEALVKLYRKYKSSKDEGLYIDLSRENLAAVAGVAKESLIRTLSDFKSENLISTINNKVHILNFKKLENLLN